MTNLIVVFPKVDVAKSIKTILVRGAFQVTGICTTGSQAISPVDGLNDGIILSSYKLMDIFYSELH